MSQVRLKTAPVVPWGVVLPPGSRALWGARQVLDAYDEPGTDASPPQLPLQKTARPHELG